MTIRNIMEDIVKSAVSEVMKNEPGLAENKSNRDDITAFVLNRISPRYITSERGILHGEIDVRHATQQRMDILFLVYEAIAQIKNRRATEVPQKSREKKEQHVLPHIIGQVLEESTMSVIPDVEICLLFEGKPAVMADSDWKNPYRSHSSIMGYYHFWPEFIPGRMKEGGKVRFELLFSREKFEELRIGIAIESIRGSSKRDSFRVPITLLKIKDGETLDFLYDK